MALSAEKSLNARTRLSPSQVFLSYWRWTPIQDGPVSLIQRGFRFAGELLRFGGTGQRRRGRSSSGDHLGHEIEIARAHETLVLYRLVSVISFLAKLIFL